MHAFLTIVLFSVALHHTWFHSNLPCHVTRWVHATVGKKWKNTWSTEGLELKYREEWLSWWLLHPRVSDYWKELLTCTVCFSWQLPFWPTIVTLITGTAVYPTILAVPITVIVVKVLK
jgi:hypothetical protein